MKAYLPISHVLLIFSILIFTSCRRNDFFLDFALGMKESEYDTLSKRYLKDGTLKRSHFVIAGNNFDENVYVFPAGQKGMLLPYFMDDSLNQMRIDIRGDTNHSISNSDYKDITEFFLSNYGSPSESGTDTGTNFEYVYWNDFKGNRIEMVYSSPDDDWAGIISVIYIDSENKETSTLSYVYSKKQEGFADDLETCSEAEDLALKDYNEGRYRFVEYGMGSQSLINFMNLARKTYGIDVRLTGSCISNHVVNCYSDKMIFLLSSKFGPGFISELYADSRTISKPLEQ